MTDDDHHKGKLSHTHTSDVVEEEEEEGFFTPSSSSSDTLLHSGFHQNITHLVAPQSDMETTSDPQLSDMSLQNKKEGLSLVSELESGISSLNLELDAIVDKKGKGGENVVNRTLRRHFSHLQKLKKEMDQLKEVENESVPELSYKLKGLVSEVNNLKQNVNYLNNQKHDSEEEDEDEGEETDLKRELDQQIESQDRERERLQAKILELEMTLTEKADEIIVLRRRVQLTESEASAKASNLSAQISDLQQQLKGEKRESQVRLTQLENHNSDLISKISYHHEVLKQREDTIIKLSEETKLVKGRFLHAADRKMDEVAEEFRKNFEDKLRILSQRIRVAEQLQAENKEHWKITNKMCESQQHPFLEKKLEKILKTRKDELCKISNAVFEGTREMESVLSKFQRKENGFMERISRVSDEIQRSKNWVRLVMEELKPLKNEPPSPLAMDDDGDEERKRMMMEEKVQRLDSKVKKAKEDKLRLMRGMYELQNKVGELEKVIVEKDEGFVRLSEEKVEAIRQLSMWIDYHQTRFDCLKEMVLVKRNITTKGRH